MRGHLLDIGIVQLPVLTVLPFRYKQSLLHIGLAIERNAISWLVVGHAHQDADEGRDASLVEVWKDVENLSELASLHASMYGGLVLFL